MGFFQQVSLKGGAADLVGYFRQSGSVRPLVLVATNKAKPPPPTVTYFESWPAERSVEESLAANREYQKQKDAMRAREVEAYKALGRAVGMDVDKLDAEAQVDAAKKKAETEAEIAERVGASK
jgi:hypothetical protein